MSLDTETPRAGHNSADPFAEKYADIEARVAAFAQGADVWEKREDITEHEAEKLNDFITGAKKLKSEADKVRSEEKAPWLAGEREVDARWKPFETRLDKIIKLVTPKYRQALDAKAKREAAEREEAEQRRREAEAAAQAAAADALKADTASARIAAEERAEAHQRLAGEAAADVRDLSGPTRIGSATGLGNQRGFKTTRIPVITALGQAVGHYRHEPELAELIKKFAARDLRNAPSVRGKKQVPEIPGIRWEEQKDVA